MKTNNSAKDNTRKRVIRSASEETLLPNFKEKEGINISNISRKDYQFDTPMDDTKDGNKHYSFGLNHNVPKEQKDYSRNYNSKMVNSSD